MYSNVQRDIFFWDALKRALIGELSSLVDWISTISNQSYLWQLKSSQHLTNKAFLDFLKNL